MRMFRRRADKTADTNARTVKDGRVATNDGRAADAGRAPVKARGGRTWHLGPTRALMTLTAVGVAGLLAWLTTNINDKTTGGYWAEYGVLAGAGLVMALSQLFGGWTKWGRPRISPMVFALAFVPTLIAVGWIMIFHQPHSTLWRGHITNWSNDLGIAGFVKDMGGDLLTMLSFGLGLVFGLSFDTTGPRRTVPPAADTARERQVEPAASEPIAREREVARS
jgi:hypothetical protein